MEPKIVSPATVEPTMSTPQPERTRRHVLRVALAAGVAATALPGAWTRPLVETLDLPVHAQTSGVPLQSGTTYFNSFNSPGQTQTSGVPAGSYTFTYTVAGMRGRVTNVEMDLEIGHPSFQNLTATIAGPFLTRELFSNVYSGSITAITGLGETLGAFTTAPLFGSDAGPTAPRYKSESGTALNAFVNQIPNGTWTVTLTNAGGTFISPPAFTLIIETA